MTEAQKTVAGRPVTGEIVQHGSYRTVQRPIEDFITLLDAVLAVPGVEAVRWAQGVPAFNDGDPCVFGIHRDFSVKLADRQDQDPEELEHQDDDGVFLSIYDLESDHPAHDPLQELDRNDGAFLDVLERSFGTYAEVTAISGGFHVDDFEVGY